MRHDETSIECLVHRYSDEVEIRFGGTDGFDLCASSVALRRLVETATVALSELGDDAVD